MSVNREALQWLEYARENLESAWILLESGLYNPSLQNAQQATEKSLKSLMIQNRIPLKRTHSISALIHTLAEHDILIPMAEDELELIDSIYLSSKYPLGSALPHFMPDRSICERCLDIARETLQKVEAHLG